MNQMPIQVKFFASLREQLGKAEAQISADQDMTVADVWMRSTAQPVLDPNVLMAVNLEYVNAEHKVKAGDEVAFFPPVTGG